MPVGVQHSVMETCTGYYSNLQHLRDGWAHWPQHTALKLWVVIASASLPNYFLEQCPNAAAHAHFGLFGAQGTFDLSDAAILNFTLDLHLTDFS